jgi:hypothetical protein
MVRNDRHLLVVELAVGGIGRTDRGDHGFAPSVHLKTGSRLPLDIGRSMAPDAQARIVDQVSRATGLERQPYPMIWSSFEIRGIPRVRRAPFGTSQN